MSHAASANAAGGAELEKLEIYSRWGQRRKVNQKSLGPVFSLCCRAGIDAALVRAQFWRVHPPSKTKWYKIVRTQRCRQLRWRLTLSEHMITETKFSDSLAFSCQNVAEQLPLPKGSCEVRALKLARSIFEII